MEKTPSRYPAIGIGGSIRSRMVHGDDPALAKRLGLAVAASPLRCDPFSSNPK